MAKKRIPDVANGVSYKPYPVIIIRLFAGFTMFFAGFEKITLPLWGPSAGVWTTAD